MKKKSSIGSEFKAFLSRGSIVDLAVGVIIGGAFTAIVTSLVNDVIMPLIGLLFGGVDFKSLKIVLTPATETAPEAALLYGSFIQSIVNFLLIAIVVFLLVRLINRVHRKKEQAPAPTPEEVLLLREIRDRLPAGKNADTENGEKKE